MGSTEEPIRAVQPGATPGFTFPAPSVPHGPSHLQHEGYPNGASLLATTPMAQTPTTSLSSEPEQSNFRRRASRLGLLSLFGRPKTTPEVETVAEGNETSWQSRPSTEGANSQDLHSSPAVTDTDTISLTRTETAVPRPASRDAVRPKKSFRKDARPMHTWTPPPLFQAYPQAVKHATLRTPSQPVETILRNNKERAGRAQGDGGGSREFDDDLEKKLWKAYDGSYHGGWVDKSFVLVSEGYLLQYAGTDAFDRLPEKILPLNEHSAAFASDAIPGKPFVLQISQVSSQDGTVDLELSKALLKKQGLRSESKRAASTFLLVLQNAREMNEWMVAVRREIDAVGGREYRPDILVSKMKSEHSVDASGMSKQTDSRQSDSSKFIENKTPTSTNLDFGDLLVRKDGDRDSERGREQEHRQSTATQKSEESRYGSGTQASIDQVHLDRLRESYASAGEGTTSTSRDSSPSRQAPKTAVEVSSDIQTKTIETDLLISEASPGLLKDFSYIYSGNRESLQPTPTPDSRPASVVPASPNRATSPPNFSVPTFSKRFSAASGSLSNSSKPQSPPPTGFRDSPSLVESEGTATDVHASKASGGGSATGELLRPKSALSTQKRFSSPQPSSRLGSPPASSHSQQSCGPGDKFSRRFSSLDYARGVSPVKLAGHSPSPHPPPTCPLPPIPSTASKPAKHASLIRAPSCPPPTDPLPHVPVSTQSSRNSAASSLPAITTPPSILRSSSSHSDMALPFQRPSPLEASKQTSQRTSQASLPSNTPEEDPPTSLKKVEGPAHSSKSMARKPTGLRRPGSSQQEPGYTPPNLVNGTPIHKTFTIDHQAAAAGTSDTAATLPPRPTREAPAPPPPGPAPAVSTISSTTPPQSASGPTKLTRRKSMPRLGLHLGLGREPPPVSPPTPRSTRMSFTPITSTFLSSGSGRKTEKRQSSTPPPPVPSVVVKQGRQEQEALLFIPPIKLSDSEMMSNEMEKVNQQRLNASSSFDGAWNVGTSGGSGTSYPQRRGQGEGGARRTFLDLSVG